ncbi:MAG: SDR family oxidoreductase [Deltaproteobacteria bacterium]|nr:SDR family oxidoreductase [Deltaproteobacteria bacterium]
MGRQLNGKTALVTGAGRGIGRCIAETFAPEGCRVWATSRSIEHLQSLENINGIQIQQLDVTDADRVSRAAETIGDIDVLVNNAGHVAVGTILDCTEADLQQTLEVNLIGAYKMIRAFLPGMLAREKGTIINIASVLSSISSAPERFAYGASKGALIGLTKSVALDYVNRGIRCNAICPATILTPGLDSRIESSPDPDALRNAIVNRHKMGRLGTVEEVAEAAVYLADDKSAFMTGQMLIMDGGMTL